MHQPSASQKYAPQRYCRCVPWLRSQCMYSILQLHIHTHNKALVFTFMHTELRADINFTLLNWQFGGKYESIKSSEWMNNGTLCKKRLYHSAFLMCRNSQETRVFSTCVNLAHPSPIFHSLASLRVCPIELLGLDWTGRRSPVSLQPPANQQ